LSSRCGSTAGPAESLHAAAGRTSGDFEPWIKQKPARFAVSMNLLESLPTVIGTAAVAPALLILWLVIAAGERPGPPARVWTAFLLGAASISLLAAARAPFASILVAAENPWLAQTLRSVFAVALPEETVK